MLFLNFFSCCLFVLLDFILCVWVFCLHACACIMCVPREYIMRSLGLELRCESHVGT